MKKCTSILCVAMTMATLLTACGNGSTMDDQADQTTNVTTTSETEVTTVSETVTDSQTVYSTDEDGNILDDIGEGVGDIVSDVGEGAGDIIGDVGDGVETIFGDTSDTE